LVKGFCNKLGFGDPSALFKHELAYVLGQMKNKTALPLLEKVLMDEKQDIMVRHEVRLFLNGKKNSIFIIFLGWRSTRGYW
jgi:hypothetical protein